MWKAEMCDAFRGSEPPVRDLPREPGFFLAEQALANLGVYSVGPDEEIAAFGRAILKVGGHASFVLLETDQTSSKLDLSGTERVGQKGDEVSPVEMVVRRPVKVLDGVAQFVAPQDTTVLPATKDDGGRADGGSRHGGAKPVTCKQAGGVGADLNARANLALRHSLLEQGNVEAGPTQRYGSRRAPDAGADHQGMKRLHRSAPQPRAVARIVSAFGVSLLVPRHAM
jgi:hypothetical protein